ncbi:hypothetical protein Nepgr_000170 [Nepenthes gracilis]|uniref:Alkyl transferase n=1 Tax=Nepenthes gracilis TaxID=150966 RepID=A0AAD3P2R0_NEPGR|nr:hypothetical protein Nepgr_000170 [Nepenthes gracilis]
MFSLQLPIVAENSFSPLKFRPLSSTIPDLSRYSKGFSHSHPSISFPRSGRIHTATTDVASQEENGKQTGTGESLQSDEQIPPGLRRELMPRHVAVIMDGNVRWARQRGLPGTAGHEAGVRSLRELIELCCRWGIKVLTIFAFSYDNWIRPKMEVDFLMNLFEKGIQSEFKNFIREGIRVSTIGDSSKLSPSLRELIAQAEEATKDSTRLQLIVAVSYSGKYDIIQACRSIAQKVKDGVVRLEDIDETLIEQELQTNCTDFPYPDLFIRTSGELRVSNFLLWQLAYTELFFVDALWPDFGEEDFVAALRSFQRRERRYGGRDLPTAAANA